MGMCYRWIGNVSSPDGVGLLVADSLKGRWQVKKYRLRYSCREQGRSNKLNIKSDAGEKLEALKCHLGISI